ncbi:MAG TPA: phage holin family protein [Burkholderiales bacterium]|nr:phage holin family protein [Burkholderiales bacterium]
MRLILRWIISALALLALPYVASGIELKSFYVALIAAVLLGLVNAVIRPVLILLTLPVTVLTLGLFILVINALLFWFVGSFIDGFHVSGFWAGFFGAILYSLITWAANALLFDGPQPPVSAR